MRFKPGDRVVSWDEEINDDVGGEVIKYEGQSNHGCMYTVKFDDGLELLIEEDDLRPEVI